MAVGRLLLTDKHLQNGHGVSLVVRVRGGRVVGDVGAQGGSPPPNLLPPVRPPVHPSTKTPLHSAALSPNHLQNH